MKVQVTKCSDKNAWYYDKYDFPISTQVDSLNGELARDLNNDLYYHSCDCIIDEEIELDRSLLYERILNRNGVQVDFSKIIENKTIKNDDGKTQYSDLPVKTLRSVAKAFNYGAKKYSKFNYTKGLEWLRYTDACQRHMESWKEFEDIDPESTNHHIDHAIASLMMLRENIHLNVGEDNRNKIYKK